MGLPVATAAAGVLASLVSLVGVSERGLWGGDFSFEPKLTGSDMRRSGTTGVICSAPISCDDNSLPIVEIDGTDNRLVALYSGFAKLLCCKRCKCVVNSCEDGGCGIKHCPPVVVFDISLERLELPGDIGS